MLEAILELAKKEAIASGISADEFRVALERAAVSFRNFKSFMEGSEPVSSAVDRNAAELRDIK